MNDPTLTIGEKILIFRRRNGYSRKQLADALGVTVSTISNYENGVTLPSKNKLSLLSDLLNVKIDMLLFDPKTEHGYIHRPKLTQSQLENMF